MILVDDDLWVGDSSDGDCADVVAAKVGAMLNVACDLTPVRDRWHGIEYAKVGLVDGPGNNVVTYVAAVLTLASLARRRKVVLVYDHDGCRATVVCMMYLNLVKGKYRPDPLQWSHWLTWEERLATIEGDVVASLPDPHQAHKDMFLKIPYGLMEAFL